jgi:hypothetical protein
MKTTERKDLVVLVADEDMKQTVQGLLARAQALGIDREITFDVFKHPRRDPGVFGEAAEFLRELQNQYRYALVMLDREGSGQEKTSTEKIQEKLQQRLDAVGWKGRSAVVVLEPELEMWVFSQSSHVAAILADGDQRLFQSILNQHPRNELGKPDHPKEVMEKILRKKGIPRTSALYRQLAERVGLSRCQDPAFQRFRNTLRTWFPEKSHNGAHS